MQKHNTIKKRLMGSLALAAIATAALAGVVVTRISGRLEINETDTRYYWLSAHHWEISVRGDGGDADLYVYDADTNELIDKDVLPDNVPVASFTLPERTRVKIVVKNADSRESCDYEGTIE